MEKTKLQLAAQDYAKANKEHCYPEYLDQDEIRINAFTEGAEWAESQKKQLDADELFDEYSSYIDDDSDSFSRIAGSSLIDRPSFIKMINTLNGVAVSKRYPGEK